MSEIDLSLVLLGWKGKRERRKGKVLLVYRIEVETALPREKPLHSKIRVNFFSLSLFPYLQCLQGFTVDIKLNY